MARIAEIVFFLFSFDIGNFFSKNFIGILKIKAKTNPMING